MANLLQKASIVLTPTAYDNGKVLCAKPSEPPYGDFDFSRNSAATRVNAQGLVENVQILSSNLVQNGDFSEEGAEEVSNGSFSQEGAELITNGSFDTDSNWTKVNATISGGTGNLDSTSGTSLLFQSALVVGKTYKAILDVTNYNGLGTCALINSNGDIQFEITSNGNKEFYFTQGGSSSNLSFRAINGGIFSIDNVSVREVGQDWSLGTGWSIGEDAVNFTYSTPSSLIQDLNVTSGFIYLIEYEIVSNSGVSLKGGGNSFFNVGSSIPTTVGLHSFYVTAVNSLGIDFRYLSGSGSLSITNISVKEVGQNWVLDANWSIAEDKAVSDGSVNGFIRTSTNVFENGKTYKVGITVSNMTTGQVTYPYDGAGSTFITTNGDFSQIYTADDTNRCWIYGRNGFDGSITNISVIEITTDTSLPRINYEGFSYQDALGSEEIVNGSFDTDSDWNKASGVTISDGKANAAFGSSGNILRQSLVTFDANKTYKYEFTISNYVSGNLKFASFIGAINESGNGTYVGYGKPNGTGVNNMILFGSFEGSIDNVSVKEYLGQEVVPDSGCGSWLWEPQSTNLITQSELFSDAYWTKNGVSVLGGFTSPSGDLSAFKLVENTSSVHVIYNPSNAFSSLTDASYSIFVKYSGRQWVRLFCEFGTTSYNSWFDILNGVTGTSSADISDIQDYGNGWFKITQTNSLDAINGRYRLYLADADNSTTYTGDGVSGVYIWGAQAENQSYATSYIPTEGSTVTRNRDVCINGGSLASINSGSGTFFVDFKYLTDNDPANANWLGIESATGNSRVLFYKGATNNQRLLITNNLDVVFTNTSLFNIVKNQQYKLAVRYDSGNISVYLNGTEIDTSTNTYTSPIENLVTINLNESNQNLGCKLKSLVVWKEGLSDQELADLTYPTPTDPTFALDFDTIATDFTFARGSEATYVDAQGLIQSTNEIGEELVVNGSFDDGLNGWSTHSGSTLELENGMAKVTTSNNSGWIKRTDLSIETGKTYFCKADITNAISRTWYLNGTGDLAPLTLISGNTYGGYVTVTGNNPTFYIKGNQTNGEVSYIDNVSVKEYITATNTPRLDYSTGAEAFLLEPQSTNLITQSELFSDGYWTKTGASVASGFLSPSGDLSAFKLVEDTSTGTHRIIRSSITVSNNSTISNSIFVKKGGRDFVRLSSYDGTSGFYAYFDLNNGVIGTVGTDTTATITEMSNGWYKCTTTFTIVGTNLLYELYACEIDNALIYQGDGTSGIYIWGAQVEQQSYATSYIPTSGTSVTRNQETCINATPEINSEEGVLYAEISALADDQSYRYITLSDGTTSNYVVIRYYNIANKISAFIENTSGVQGSTSHSFSPSETITNFHKVAFKWKANDFALWIDGTEVNTQSSGTTFSANVLNKLQFNEGDGGGNEFFGNTKDVQVYTKALSDAELIKLTTI